MVNNKRCCGTCKWHKREPIDGGFICVNARSEKVADWTGDEEWCREWERKEIKEISVVLDEGAYMPERPHDADAGLDLRTRETVTIPPGGSAAIDTGVHMEIPEGYFGKLESKSGLNVKYSVVSHGGVIDSGYTGSIVAKLYNHGKEPFVFQKGDKCIQIIIQPCENRMALMKVDRLEETERGNDGFGSTGR
jgi:dUTP pyrophosphatase